MESRYHSFSYFTPVILSLFVCATNAQSNNSTVSNSTNQYHSTYNSTHQLLIIRNSIHCYSLPYGAIGCASHVLTYYCLTMNALGRKPLMPWKLQEHAWINVFIGLVQLIGSCIVSAKAISRCGGSKEMQLLGVWMILTSIAAGVASMFGNGLWIGAKRNQNAEEDDPNLHPTQPYATAYPSTGSFNLKTYGLQGYASVPPSVQGSQLGVYHQQEITQSTDALYETSGQPVKKRKFFQRDPNTKRRGKFFQVNREVFQNGGNTWGLRGSWGAIGIIWLAGCAMGAYGSVLVGLKVFVISENGHVWKITVGFFGLPTLIVVLWALSCLTATRGKDIKECASFGVFALKVCLVFLIAMLFYMDWLLAAVTGNWWGTPKALEKDGQILYWAYFGIKRLAFFSS